MLDCRAVCHIECKNKVPLPCVHSVSTPKKMKLKVGSTVLVVPGYSSLSLPLELRLGLFLSQLHSSCPITGCSLCEGD